MLADGGKDGTMAAVCRSKAELEQPDELAVIRANSDDVKMTLGLLKKNL